ncbi:MAG: aminoglycoside phosphotransferase family protein [Cyanobacteria bacterium SZAS-4]|nr:aminoglycoside phosphotransferase family protein [Cyanobacteria bacterium SZAS-4]
MELSVLQSHVHTCLEDNAHRLGLNPNAIELSYVLNLGGFVNASFTATDGVRKLHVKASQSDESDRCFRQWYQIHQTLEQNYHAPKLLLQFTVPDSEHVGFVFEHIDGEIPKSLSTELAREVLVVLQRLHTDTSMQKVLYPKGFDAPTFADCYEQTFHERFTEDLAIVKNDLPPFVDQKCFDWMRQQAEILLSKIKKMPAFRRRSDSLAHCDLWLNNLLVDTHNNFWILDWDDLAISDPALDLVMLLGPSVESIEPFDASIAKSLNYPIDKEMHERLKIYAPARLLDWVIDPLADYVEAESAPQVAETVREKNRQFHLAAKIALETCLANE